MAACGGGRNGSSNILTLPSPVTQRKGSKGSKVSALPRYLSCISGCIFAYVRGQCAIARRIIRSSRNQTYLSLATSRQISSDQMTRRYSRNNSNDAIMYCIQSKAFGNQRKSRPYLDRYLHYHSTLLLLLLLLLLPTLLTYLTLLPTLPIVHRFRSGIGKPSQTGLLLTPIWTSI